MADIINIIDFDHEMNAVNIKIDEKEIIDNIDDDEIKPVCHKRKNFNVYRKAYSEISLFDILGIDDLKEGYSYHCLSGGKIDSLTYIKYILRQQNLKYLLFSTWCLANDDIEEMRKWLMTGRIGRIDAYVGEIFPSSYADNYNKLFDLMKKYKGRLCIARNHSKIYAGFGDKYHFAIESSANINTNPRIENTVITISEDIYMFYKNFFDGLKSFNRDFDDWEKYENN